MAAPCPANSLCPWEKKTHGPHAEPNAGEMHAGNVLGLSRCHVPPALGLDHGGHVSVSRRSLCAVFESVVEHLSSHLSID